MKISKILPAFILVLCLFIVGCNSAESPQPTAEPPTNTAPQIAVLPTQAPDSTTIPPTPTIPTSSTPTFYPDIWLSGLIWFETDGRPTFYVGNGSIDLANAQITYEPLNESVAAELAQYEHSTLVVLFGDYTPSGDYQGHLVVERVQPVHLPYSEDTPFSESYTHPEYGFSFNYPGGWTLRVLDGSPILLLFNSPPGSEQYYGPGIGGIVYPTLVMTDIRIEAMPPAEIVQARLDLLQNEGSPPEFATAITVTERIINNLPVTQIDQKQFNPSQFGPNIISFIIPLSDSTSLLFNAAAEDAPFVERLIATLSLPETT